MLPTLLILLVAYLAGSIPFGYLVARARGVDIFAHGSGNIGATNVGRVLGRRFGILVFVLDFAKGAVPVLAAGWLSRQPGWDIPTFLIPHGLAVGSGLAAFLGHLFPIALKFRGGKGVATGAGVLAVLLPVPFLGAAVVWLGLLLATSYMSLASLLAGAALCGFHVLADPAPWSVEHLPLTLFCFVTAALVVIRHRGNLARLRKGTENRLQGGPAMVSLAKVVHVLALGLWFGMGVFFSFVVALSLFNRFEALAELPREERPVWFPVAAPFDQAGPELRKEQGTRAAGEAVSPLFDWYFLLQGVCGFLAVATALNWPKQHPERVHRARLLVLLVAVATVVAGWPLERKVSALRAERNETRDAALRSTDPAATAAADAARQTFGRWHTYSLFLNLLTVLLVTVGMAQAAFLPATPPPGLARPPAPPEAPA